MKVLIFTDNHFCENMSSSISGTHRYDKKYPWRIENQLKSLAWVEQIAIEKGCSAVICAGDFFNKPDLTEKELTAIRDIVWNDLPHYFLVGNHESSVNGLSTSSTKALENCKAKRYVISEPTILGNIRFLPYVIESDRKPVFDYFGAPTADTIIISHNDLKGIQMGPVVSKTGFEIEDLENNAALVVNGHLHNGQAITKKIINLGNLTGQTFGEDATKYSHNIMILDTETLKYELIENPYAFNFYKFTITAKEDEKIFEKLKDNAIIWVNCPTVFVEEVKTLISTNKKIMAHKLTILRDTSIDSTAVDLSSFTVDHIAKFIECVRLHYGTDPILEAELAEVCK